MTWWIEHPFEWSPDTIHNRGEWAEYAARLFLRRHIDRRFIHRTNKLHSPDIILGDFEALFAKRMMDLLYRYGPDVQAVLDTFATTHYLFLENGKWGLVQIDDRFPLPGVPHIIESDLALSVRKRPSGGTRNQDALALCFKAERLVYRDITHSGDLWAAVNDYMSDGFVLIWDVKLGHRSQLKNVNVTTGLAPWSKW